MGKGAFLELHWAAVPAGPARPYPPRIRRFGRGHAWDPGDWKPTGKNGPPAVWGFGFFVCSVQPVFVFAGVHGGEHAWVLVTPRAAPAPSDVPACVSGTCFPPPVHTFGRRLG